MNETFWIKCKIERGGFTNERTFEIELGGDGRLIGTANVEYVLDDQKQPLEEDAPAYGESISGFVQCRKLEEKAEAILIELPSSDVIHVHESALVPS